jgi:hypothetical protein
MRWILVASLSLACAAQSVGALAADPASPSSAAPAPAPPAAASAEAPPAAPPASGPVQAAPAPAPAPEPPRITYLFRPGPPILEDKTALGTAVSAGLGSLGGVAGAAVAGAAAGGVGMAAGAKAGADDILPNPANGIAAKVARLAAPNLGAVLADTPAQVGDVKPQGSTDQKYAQIAGGARYIVNVQTYIFRSVWASYATWPLDLKHYILEYMGNVTIRDITASKDVFRGRCFVFTKRTPDLPTHDQLYADNGAILKTFIGQTVDDCVAQLQEKNADFQQLTRSAVAAN